MKSPLALVILLSILAALPSPAATPEPAGPDISLRDFKLIGKLSEDRAAFTLTARARVENARGGALDLLSGRVGLTELGPRPKWHLRADDNRFVLEFDRRGEFPIELKFDAAVTRSNDWNSVDFRVAPSALQQIVLQGLAADTEFLFAGAARPDRTGNDFVSYLPSDGTVRFSWKQARPETEGKLFFAAEMLSQVTVTPGLMRQHALFDFKVMQGELTRVTLLLRGAGEVTRVQGDQVLAWNLEPVQNSGDRRLVIQLNQPQKDRFPVQVQTQTPLGAFPQTADVLQLRPEQATRFAGYYRVVNEGAVRLEVSQAIGTSQVSPEQFPETDATRAAFRAGGNQRFVYRFSSGDVALRIQADQILPEVTVSELLLYHHGENELAVDAEIELDIREAPLRELLLRVPKGYAVARLNASGMTDYFLRETAGEADAELRLVYGQPVSGRQLVQLRVERNQALGETNWALPRIEVARARSVRGFVGVSADAGFRMMAERTEALTEIATAFFPKKAAGIQTAFRISDPGWSAVLHVERLPQTVQADVLHLFSIGEGIAYGSTLMNYSVSGAPVAAFKVELSGEYANVEFTGKDIRSWQKTDGGYIVQLHTPVSGAYALLATYERPFKAQGETLAFTGARPADAQSEQGYTLVISAYQFRVTPTEVSPGLLRLETGEVPPEYRLFFDAPVLAAYRYAARPFTLQLALSPLAQGESLNQIVDRAVLTTRVANEGQVLTDVRYYIKNRGNPHFRLTLPEQTALWSVAVNDTAVVPVTDGKANLIPLPQANDPTAVLRIDLKLASRAKDPKHLRITAPTVHAPVMLAEWNLKPDTGQRLVYRGGSIKPSGGPAEASGFAQLARMFRGRVLEETLVTVFAGLALLAAALLLWRRALIAGAAGRTGWHRSGSVIGLVGFALMIVVFVHLLRIAGDQTRPVPDEITLLAPVQQAGSPLTVQVTNVVAGRVSVLEVVHYGWPVLLAAALWAYGWFTENQSWKRARGIAAWTLLAWAALRVPNGAVLFFWALAAFLVATVVIPVSRQLWIVARTAPRPVPPDTGAASATVALLVAMALAGTSVQGQNQSAAQDKAAGAGSVEPVMLPQAATPQSVTHHIRVEDKYALAAAKIRWQARKDDRLPLLAEPAVLTRLVFPTRALKIVPAPAWAVHSQELVAREDGTFDIELQYQLHVPKEAGSGFTLPLRYGLVNRVDLTLANLDVEVFSPNAVSVHSEHIGTNTIASLVLSPANAWIGWKPRSRDVRREKPVFYAELWQLYVPSAGIIEGAHHVAIRAAQGELSELVFSVPPGATITDVTDAAKPAGRAPSLVSVWRFDPDTRKLRVTLNPAQSRPFALLIRSQVATGTLPFEQTVGLLSVDQASGQIGLLGVATGNEVQLDAVRSDAFSPINLEDYPGHGVSALQGQFPGLTVRRAFRYAAPGATATITASAVEPDVRVEAQNTLSMGEDRTVLAANITVDITRAGVFRLSFLLPAGFDVESIAGKALSHWTEMKSDAGRVITLHLTGKTEGRQQFAISLAGPGVKTAQAWAVPQITLREAGKQQGTLLIVPEQGMRLQVAAREGMTQLDPQKSGIREKGVLAFRILQGVSSLVLEVQQVDSWIQVTSLQHAAVSDGQVKVAANLQYQVENTGLKTFRVMLPAEAEGVRFQGDQVADFLQVPGASTNGLQLWEIKLHRRVIGSYLLRVHYQTVTPAGSPEVLVRGIEAADVDLQRGFVTVQSDSRLQLTADALPSALQPTEWQSIPRGLRQDLAATVAEFAWRLVEPTFNLPLRIQRHEAASLLPARIKSINFNSVVSDDGEMLTQVRLEIVPGDLRLLNVELPKAAHFWFAFVNDNGVWPWRDGDRFLIPLEQQSRVGKPVPVELYYSCRAGRAGSRSLDLELLAPKFDLPLENITWQAALSDRWRIRDWSGSFQLQRQSASPMLAGNDLQSYLQNEVTLRTERTKEAEEFIALGNDALAKGDPQQARRAFEAAFGLSRHDAAFNEDARVQLHNVKLQQALVGLNVRQAVVAGDTGALGEKVRDLRARKELNYTQQDAKEIIDNNTADDNTSFLRLAERLIQQQDAAVTSPGAIRASIPGQGQVLVFHRAVAVDPRADLRINLEASVARAVSLGMRVLILAGIVVLLTVLAAVSLRVRNPGIRERNPELPQPGAGLV